MHFRYSAFALAALLAIAAGPAAAADNLHLSGFGTLGWSHQNRDDADYVRPGQPKRSAFGLDSNLGLQASAEFDPRFSGTVQVLTRREYTDHFRPAVEWAFLRAKLSDEVAVRVGRVALPAYLVSDSRHVGYANIAIRPPAEVYGQVPLTGLNGIDAIGTRSYGDLTWTVQAAYGKMKNKYAAVTGDSIAVDGRHTLSLALTLETGPFTFRMGHVRTDLTISGSPQLVGLLGALKQTGFGALAQRLDPTDKRASFTGLGLSMDYRNVLLQTELARRTTDSYVADSTSAYVLLGYRMGDFVPYAGYGKLRIDSPRSDATVPRVGPLLPLAAGVDSLLIGEAQRTQTLGLRWNALPYASVKLQADFLRPQGGIGFLMRAQPTYTGQTVRVVAAAVDFVF